MLSCVVLLLTIPFYAVHNFLSIIYIMWKQFGYITNPFVLYNGSSRSRSGGSSNSTCKIVCNEHLVISL